MTRAGRGLFLLTLAVLLFPPPFPSCPSTLAPFCRPAILQSAQMALTSVESLRGLGEFTVKVEGNTLESFPSKARCVYFEWAAGYKRDGEWVERIWTVHSGQPLTIVTPRGLLEASFGSLRLYLPAAASHRYSQDDQASAPELIREQWKHDGRPIDLDEICVAAGRTYYAMVEDVVLAISDRPFKDGKAQRPLTPSYQLLTPDAR